MKRLTGILGLCLFLGILSGCSSAGGNTGMLPVYKIPAEEAQWIRNGEPLVFEDEMWFPQDEIDILLDSEVSLLGEYRGVQFFIDRADVRPYDRLYTKFDRNKFRIFKRKNDPNNQAR